MPPYSDVVEFVVIYRRSTTELLSLESFDRDNGALRALEDADRANEDPDVEVVLLTSKSLESLKATHGRYFAGGSN